MKHTSTSLLGGQLKVSRETMSRLESFQALFIQWSKRINLVAASTQEDVWRRHIEDSAQLLLLKPEMKHIVDIGSGGGFPGAVLAVMLDDVEDAQVHLVESNSKKTAFLQAVRARCAGRAFIHNGRIEQVLPTLKTPEFITARALASLDTLLEFTQNHLEAGATALFHKGREYKREIEESHGRWTYDLVVHESRIDPDSVILEISGLSENATSSVAE